MSHRGQEVDKPLRLNEDVRRALLVKNEGFTDSTSYSSKNFSEDRRYEITGGELHVHSNSNTSWAASRNSSDYVADAKTAHRFLSKNLHRLDTDGVAEEAALARKARKAEAAALADQAPVDESDPETPTVLPPGPEVGGSRAPTTTTATSTEKVVMVAAGVIIVVWALPHAKRMWDAKGRPRVQAWRDRRATKKALPADQDASTHPDESPQDPA